MKILKFIVNHIAPNDFTSLRRKVFAFCTPSDLVALTQKAFSFYAPNDLVSLERKILIKKISITLILIFSTTASMATNSIILRNSVVTQGDIWRGQRVIIDIDVLSNAGWAKIKNMREPEIPGMYLIKTETQGTRLNETINNESYTGQRYEFSVFPQRAGELTIPAIPIDIETTVWGNNAKNDITHKQTPPIKITVKNPPGSDKTKELISTPQLILKQSWEPEPEFLKVGEAFKRIITITATDVSGMVFSPLDWEKFNILDIYPGTPEVTDKIEDNIIIGTRIETATYVCQQAGTVTLPPISISWWNLKTDKLIQEKLSALTLQIKPNEQITTKGISNAHRNLKSIWLIIISIVIAIILLIWIYRHHRKIIKKQFNSIIKRYNNSERAYFRRFTASCRNKDNRITYNSLLAWINHTDKSFNGQTEAFAEQYGDKQFKDQIEQLWNAIEINIVFNKVGLLKSAQQARAKWKKHLYIKKKISRTLPPLNPDISDISTSS